MTDPLFWHRVQFGFTVTFHYLFPQLTMGLALLIVILQALALRTGASVYDQAARFWARIFGINFAIGVVTGIPMEFQFGTNWARFSHFSGGVIGQTLGMEGMFAFFLESTMLGLFLYGAKRLGPQAHFVVAILLWLGSWLSGYFIIATNAFMQHPQGHLIAADGTMQLSNFWEFVGNPWAFWQYAHNMSAAVVTASFVMCSIAALWILSGRHLEHAKVSLRVGVPVALLFCVLQIFPTGDRHGKMVAEYQPATLAGMEGLFEGGERADLAIIGQPDVANQRLDNPIVVPGALSFLAYGTFGSTVRGLNDFPADQRPDSIEVLYYAYHMMAGLGTIFLALMAVCAFYLWRGSLMTKRPLLWMLMLAAPLPYIATTAGWMTAEVGRQPWLIYGLMRTYQGTSPLVTAGDTIFTLLGFCALYFLLGILFLYLVGQAISRGPNQTEVA